MGHSRPGYRGWPLRSVGRIRDSCTLIGSHVSNLLKEHMPNNNFLLISGQGLGRKGNSSQHTGPSKRSRLNLSMNAFFVSSVAYARRLMSNPSPLFSNALRIPFSVQNVAIHDSGACAISKRISAFSLSTFAPWIEFRSASPRKSKFAFPTEATPETAGACKEGSLSA